MQLFYVNLHIFLEFEDKFLHKYLIVILNQTLNLIFISTEK